LRFTVTDAAKLHRDSIVFDLHEDTLSQVNDRFKDVDLVTGEGAPEYDLHVTIPRLRDGGVDAVCWAIYTHSREKTPDFLNRALGMAGRAYGIAHRSGAVVARTAQDIRDAKAAGKLAIVLTIENAILLGGKIEPLYSFHALGVRVLGLVWNTRNELGAGITTAKEGEGLTDFGKKVVREAGKIGMIIDLAHLTEEGVRDVLDSTDAPVISTHTNARGKCNVPRNHQDDTIREIAKRGGVLGVNFCPKFLNNTEKAALDDVLEMIVYLMEIAGPGAVALGSDYDGIRRPPEGLERPDRLQNLTAALIDRGLDEETVCGFLGGNAMRVFETVCG